MTTEDCLTGAKGALQSKTIWGSLLQLLPLLDIAVSAAGYPGAVNDTVAIISGAIGGLLVIYGRITAKAQIQGLMASKKREEQLSGGPRSYPGPYSR